MISYNQRWFRSSRSVTDCCYEADGLQSFLHKSSVRLEHFRSIQFCFKWKRPMFPRRSSRTPKPSRRYKRSQSPKEDDVQHKLTSRKQRRRGRRKTNTADSKVKTKQRGDSDILDIINSKHTDKAVTEEGEGDFVEVADKGVDQSDEECVTADISIVSGPTILLEASPEKERPPQSLCSACHKIYQRAKRMRTPIKDKLLDNDPKSLTCDQWVLLKSWRPRRLPGTAGKLLAHITLVKRRLRFKTSTNPSDQCGGERDSSPCSRPHIFLQRSLRQCVKFPTKRNNKKNRRKRKRNEPSGPCVSKQPRLQITNHHPHSDTNFTKVNGRNQASRIDSSPLEGCSDEEMDTVTVELIPCSVTLELDRDAPANQKAGKRRGRFGDLLAQLKGNSSVIVKETK